MCGVQGQRTLQVDGAVGAAHQQLRAGVVHGLGRRVAVARGSGASEVLAELRVGELGIGGQAGVAGPQDRVGGRQAIGQLLLELGDESRVGGLGGRDGAGHRDHVGQAQARAQQRRDDLRVGAQQGGELLSAQAEELVQREAHGEELLEHRRVDGQQLAELGVGELQGSVEVHRPVGAAHQRLGARVVHRLRLGAAVTRGRCTGQVFTELGIGQFGLRGHAAVARPDDRVGGRQAIGQLLLELGHEGAISRFLRRDAAGHSDDFRQAQARSEQRLDDLGVGRLERGKLLVAGRSDHGQWNAGGDQRLDDGRVLVQQAQDDLGVLLQQGLQRDGAAELAEQRLCPGAVDVRLRRASRVGGTRLAQVGAELRVGELGVGGHPRVARPQDRVCTRIALAQALGEHRDEVRRGHLVTGDGGRQLDHIGGLHAGLDQRHHHDRVELEQGVHLLVRQRVDPTRRHRIAQQLGQGRTRAVAGHTATWLHAGSRQGGGQAALQRAQGLVGGDGVGVARSDEGLEGFAGLGDVGHDLLGVAQIRVVAAQRGQQRGAFAQRRGGGVQGCCELRVGGGAGRGFGRIRGARGTGAGGARWAARPVPGAGAEPAGPGTLAPGPR